MGKSQKIIVAVSVAVAIISIAFAILMWKKANDAKVPEPTPTTTPVPTTAYEVKPTVTPTESVQQPTPTGAPDGGDENVHYVKFITLYEDYWESVVKYPGVTFVMPDALSDSEHTEGLEFVGWGDVDHPEVVFAPGDEYTEDRDITVKEQWRIKKNDNVPEESGLNEITLSGKKEDHVITDRYCYYEGDKFFLLLDKDLDLPGDFGDNVAAIIDALEKEIGFEFTCSGKNDRLYLGDAILGVKDPWRELDNEMKVVIYVFVDREDKHNISYATSGGLTLYMYELYSDELWNSVDSYRNNPWRRSSTVDYGTVAHELTHVLTLRYYDGTSKIMTEGSAEYYAETVIASLAGKNKDFAECYEGIKDLNRSWINELVTKDNAEEIFADDYRNLDHANRGDEYTFGRGFCEFLSETYGKTFMKKYLDAAKEKGLESQYSGLVSDTDIKKHAVVMKELFGDDVFVKFAAWVDQHYQ
ncbi:MAG: hypothetical protein IKX54_02600 [Lachnospiraceae bacterium]|nr:hypothetical protein [Lachnospiraceae bacterium]